jgi:hypothetical protein
MPADAGFAYDKPTLLRERSKKHPVFISNLIYIINIY